MVGAAEASPSKRPSPSALHPVPVPISLPVGDIRVLPESPSAPVALAVPPGDVLVVAGLPGAGKSTLLRSAAGERDVVLDPERLSTPLRRMMPGIPYRLVRPFVHTVHRLRVLYELARGTQHLIIHEPGARPHWRRLLARAVRSRGRAVHLLVILADPTAAAAGRVRRARTLPAPLAARHERAWSTLCDELAHGWASSRLAAEGFTGCTLLPRSAIPAIISLRTDDMTEPEHGQAGFGRLGPGGC